MYPKAKVYSDGGHYIAIPHTEQPYRARRKPKEEIIEVPDEPKSNDNNCASSEIGESEKPKADENIKTKAAEETEGKSSETVPSVRRITKKQLFNETYKAHYTDRKSVRRKVLIETMSPYFKDRESAEYYVDAGIARKQKNLIARRIRMVRKANLADFNYFVTFTYDSALHTEETFRKKLKNALALFSHRKGWKYIGVWERSPEKKRLHFHGLFYIPDGTLPGEMKEVNGYSFSEHKRKITHENSYFRERFGRNDFDDMVTEFMLDGAITYILKYIEKSGEKIVYSRGLPQFFISDIMDEDVICPMGEEEQKLLLFDRFTCWDEGCYIGEVSKEVIAQMPKCN